MTRFAQRDRLDTWAAALHAASSRLGVEMSTPIVLRIAARVLIAGLLAGCDVPGIDPLLPAGSRQWIVTVENESNRPAVLIVAEDAGQPGRVVGTTRPNSVPPGATVDVTFGVPPGRTWAIFVNPGPQRGPLIVAHDVPPAASGTLPLTITVGGNGDPSVAVPDLPGWFGN